LPTPTEPAVAGSLRTLLLLVERFPNRQLRHGGPRVPIVNDEPPTRAELWGDFVERADTLAYVEEALAVESPSSWRSVDIWVNG
jgi:hypothetical protein